MSESELISVISHASDYYGDKLIEFMNNYELNNLAQATQEQLEDFIKTEDLQK